MADYSDRETDKRLLTLERRLKKLYKDATKELRITWDQYYQGWDEVKDGKTIRHKGLVERYAEEFAAYEAGKYHDETGKYTDLQMFNRWWYAQEARGDRIGRLCSDMAERITTSNEEASALINDTTRSVYQLNKNWSAYMIEEGHKDDKVQVAFNLVNENTLARLSKRKNQVSFRITGIKHTADYNWNQRLIITALEQGIMQGESAYKIADRFEAVMGRNHSAAVRNARTAITSAQNGGRLDTYKEAANMGIKIKKRWLATQDERTRESHVEIDGETVELDEDFSNGLNYPADPLGEPCEVYNCRCTMVSVDPVLDGKKFRQAGYERWVANNARRANRE